jgi:benzoyl-CoA reductase subunit B
MEKITGTKCDDEALCRGVRNEWETDVLLARILELNKAIPAPLDMKLFAALEFPAWPTSSKDVTVQYFRALYDEVKDRVANGIAAVATERCRLFHEAAPPFPLLNLLKAGHKYGAVFVGGSGFMVVPPALVVGEDWSLTAAKTLEEQGIQLRSRDDALRALAKLYLYNSPVGSWFTILPRAKIVTRAVQDWHVDGVVIHIDHGCQGMPAGMGEVQLELKEMGIPTMAYEAHSVDGRGYNEAQLLDSFESFFENLGLSEIA